MDTNFDKKIFIENFKNLCQKVQIKKFVKGETVTNFMEDRNQLCILLDGKIDLVRYDFNGNKTIIGHYEENDIFGEVFYATNSNNELFAVAKKNSEVLFFPCASLSTKCNRNCDFHKFLSNHLNELFLEQIMKLNLRIELLTKRTIRNKILTYFDILSNHSLKKTFTIPFSYTDLADFLSIDRSAMMRELKLLCDEGLIEKNGNKITLLY